MLNKYDKNCEIGKYLNANSFNFIECVADNLVLTSEGETLNTTINASTEKAINYQLPILWLMIITNVFMK